MPPPRRVKVANSHILPPYKTNILAAKIATIMRCDTTYKRPSMAAWKMLNWCLKSNYIQQNCECLLCNHCQHLYLKPLP